MVDGSGIPGDFPHLPSHSISSIVHNPLAMSHFVSGLPLRSAATLPLVEVYREEANGYDICDVRGEVLLLAGGPAMVRCARTCRRSPHPQQLRTYLRWI